LKGNNVEIDFIDTLGQEVFRQLTGGHYRGAQICLLMFDITNQKSFDNLDLWVKAIERNAHDAITYLVGNKSDLEKERVITTDQGETYATDRMECNYMETSALDNSNVDELFNHIAEVFIEKD